MPDRAIRQDQVCKEVIENTVRTGKFFLSFILYKNFKDGNTKVVSGFNKLPDFQRRPYGCMSKKYQSFK